MKLREKEGSSPGWRYGAFQAFDIAQDDAFAIIQNQALRDKRVDLLIDVFARHAQLQANIGLRLAYIDNNRVIDGVAKSRAR